MNPAQVRCRRSAEWVDSRDEEAERREVEAERKRLATRAANAKNRPPRPPAPRTGKPAVFYQPLNLDMDKFPAHLRWPILYFLTLIHWKWCCRKANRDGFVQLLYSLITKVIPRADWKAVKAALIERGVVECDGMAARGRKALGFRVAPD